MKKQKFLGHKCTLLSSLALLIISLWEIGVRLDAMYAPLKMFFSMAIGEGIPFADAMEYFDVGIFEAPIWLLLCSLTALATIFFIRRPAGAVITLPLTLTLAVYGLIRETTFFTGLWRLIQPSLLLFNAFLIMLNLSARSIRSRFSAKNAPSSLPDAPRLRDAPRLKNVSQPSADRSKRSA